MRRDARQFRERRRTTHAGMFGAGVPVHTIYNSVDLERFNPPGPRADLDALAGLPPLAAAGIRIGLVGTFARWKGHGVFLDALARLRDLATRARLHRGRADLSH